MSVEPEPGLVESLDLWRSLHAEQQPDWPDPGLVMVARWSGAHPDVSVSYMPSAGGDPMQPLLLQVMSADPDPAHVRQATAMLCTYLAENQIGHYVSMPPMPTTLAHPE